MTVLPFHPDARLLAILEPLYVTAGALVLGLMLRRIVDRYLAEDDPRRLYVAQGLLYGGAFIVIAVSASLRQG